ncbi:hypothetical protein [Streptomyces sp. NPDC048224]|uniref:hypothetical protein n=1 Tax=Streptomyces sp. NPDC048224 TaxID=3154500 RepID=UPI003408391B
MTASVPMHFHCPACHPQLLPGTTPAICGQVIPPPIVGTGPSHKCPACKSALRRHQASHRK